MMTDPIADMLTAIKNGYFAGKDLVITPHSKFKETVARVLHKGGYIKEVRVMNNNSKINLQIDLLYTNKQPKMTHVERISSPGRRVYSDADNLKKYITRLGDVIISTSTGVMTVKEARKKRLGGEVICKIW